MQGLLSLFQTTQVWGLVLIVYQAEDMEFAQVPVAIDFESTGFELYLPYRKEFVGFDFQPPRVLTLNYLIDYNSKTLKHEFKIFGSGESLGVDRVRFLFSLKFPERTVFVCDLTDNRPPVTGMPSSGMRSY